ncbi:FtsH protease activity modulator HflK [Pelagovum pacificum]|uniref:Protein HflK n=1 Tax=Pelagovum pacificum TaxID=2588711 RepID=A0A5C5GGP5_9RHOB|nr:FtsH protease activity modulator HflK [Pelagovum pacificum]QQA44169.1 FtsH protease activity modulator HflK [Pelagovum pacificum]TNY32706.1 FtsH protease activity modulator HflK [Pelagovum pacificum]
MAGNNGGPWGGGGGNRGSGGNDGGDDRRPAPGRRPGDGGNNMPDIDQLMNKGRDQLRVLMGGRGGNNNGSGGGGGGAGPAFTRGTVGIAALVAVGLWLVASFYTVRPEERSVELFLGDFYSVGDPGLNFAPWPVVTAEVIPVTREQTIDIGTSSSGEDAGLMLTGDENIVDIDFQIVWNITDPAQYLFNLADPPMTIEAVAESAMREIIAQSDLAPILNRDRAPIAERLQDLVQSTLDSYDSGVNIVRVNFDKADPPADVIASFRAVQDAEQERERLQNVADAYANRVLAEARGEAAQVLEEAEGYRARVVNEAQGEASRFAAVLTEYANAPEVTRKRIYLETMEQVLGGTDIILLDENASGDGGVVPYLPLDEVRRSSGAAATQSQAEGGSN